MQGWRNTQEDSHICSVKLQDDVSVFGVFDGHGGIPIPIDSNIGREVALYVQEIFIAELKKLHSFQNRDYTTALKEVFIKMDEILKTPAGLKEVTRFSMNE